ncbi:MAG: 23S rRNA (uracil(1939)-C(5))-methyltransferase RlmD [Melioribacteraceae bacterium]|nr:23S rRNA (uracil(1939)-C(5))-methyltransferase RlmD [Melioribacteraceae bacterium]
MKKGDILEFEIESYAFEGKGIAKIDNPFEGDSEKKYVVFVNGSYPGDVVKAMIIKKKKSFAEARVTEVIKAAPERVDVKCNYFGVCGGCKQQNLDYNAQLKYKEAQVKEIFEHMGGFTDFEFEPIIASENIFFYRNKMEYSFADRRWLTKEELKSDGEVEDRFFALGLHIPRMFDKVVDISECFLQSELSNKVLNFTRDFFKSRNATIYSTKTHEGYLRNLVIKHCHHTNNLMVNLVTHTDESELMKQYSDELLEVVPEITTIINNINEKKSQVAIGDYEIVYHGDGYIYDTIGKHKYRISANSFFQTNTLQAEHLYNVALEYAGIKEGDIVYDLYSGAGTISIYVSEKPEKVFAIEAVAPAVEDAMKNLELNDIDNVEFALADLNKSFLPIIEEIGIPKPDVIIADPPRSGMNPKTVKDILALKPRQISYVSCNPTTQVRDIKLLCEAGYKLVKVRPVDMFPHTYHIENCAMLVLED